MATAGQLRVKVFNRAHEDEINEWLAANPRITIHRTDLAGVPLSHGSDVIPPSSPTFRYVVLYSEPVKGSASTTQFTMSR